MSTSPHLGLAYLVASQAQKEITHNDALNDLDCLVQPTVLDRSLSVPPASPSDGAAYIVGPSPTGAWSDKANQIAIYFAGWRFKEAENGWQVYVQDENRLIVFNGTTWQPLVAAYEEASLTWNPGTLANGSGSTSSALSVAGAVFGDFAHVAAPYDLQGLLATAYVSAAGSVKIRLQNQTGASVSLVSGSWKVRVHKG